MLQPSEPSLPFVIFVDSRGQVYTVFARLLKNIEDFFNFFR